MNDLQWILFLMLACFFLLASADVDCRGKSFHCINSTHFNVCVDLGTGSLRTIDSVIIPCPDGTVCFKTNFYECEFPTSTTPVLRTSEVKNFIDVFGAKSTGILNPATTTFSKDISGDSTYNTVVMTTLSELEKIKEVRLVMEHNPEDVYITTRNSIVNPSIPVKHETAYNDHKQNITEFIHERNILNEKTYSTNTIPDILKNVFYNKTYETTTINDENINVTNSNISITETSEVNTQNEVTTESINNVIFTSTINKVILEINTSTTEPAIQTSYTRLPSTLNQYIEDYSTEPIPKITESLITYTSENQDILGTLHNGINDVTADSINYITVTSTTDKNIVQIDSLTTESSVQTPPTQQNQVYSTGVVPELPNSLIVSTYVTEDPSINEIIDINTDNDLTTESEQDVTLISSYDKQILELQLQATTETHTTHLPSTVNFITDSILEITESLTTSTSRSQDTSGILYNQISILNGITVDSINGITSTTTNEQNTEQNDLLTTESAQTLVTQQNQVIADYPTGVTLDFTHNMILSTFATEDGSINKISELNIGNDVTIESMWDDTLISTFDKHIFEIDSTIPLNTETRTTHLPSTMDFVTESIPKITQSLTLSTSLSPNTWGNKVSDLNDVTTESGYDDTVNSIIENNIEEIDLLAAESSAQTSTTYITSTVNQDTEEYPTGITPEIINNLIMSTFVTEDGSLNKISKLNTENDVTTESMRDVTLIPTFDKHIFEMDSTIPLNTETRTTHLPSTTDFVTKSIPKITQSLTLSTSLNPNTLGTKKSDLNIPYDVTTESVHDAILNSIIENNIEEINLLATGSSAQTSTIYITSTLNQDTEDYLTGFTPEITNNLITSTIVTEDGSVNKITKINTENDVTTESMRDVTLISSFDKNIFEIASTIPLNTETTYLPSATDLVTESIPEITQSLPLSTSLNQDTWEIKIIDLNIPYDVTTESVHNGILTIYSDAPIDENEPISVKTTTYSDHDLAIKSTDDVILSSTMENLGLYMGFTTTETPIQTSTIHSPSVKNQVTEDNTFDKIISETSKQNIRKYFTTMQQPAASTIVPDLIVFNRESTESIANVVTLSTIDKHINSINLLTTQSNAESYNTQLLSSLNEITEDSEIRDTTDTAQVRKFPENTSGLIHNSKNILKEKANIYKKKDNEVKHVNEFADLFTNINMTANTLKPATDYFIVEPTIDDKNTPKVLVNLDTESFSYLTTLITPFQPKMSESINSTNSLGLAIKPVLNEIKLFTNVPDTVNTTSVVNRLPVSKLNVVTDYEYTSEPFHDTAVLNVSEDVGFHNINKTNIQTITIDMKPTQIGDQYGQEQNYVTDTLKERTTNALNSLQNTSIQDTNKKEEINYDNKASPIDLKNNSTNSNMNKFDVTYKDRTTQSPYDIFSKLTHSNFRTSTTEKVTVQIDLSTNEVRIIKEKNEQVKILLPKQQTEYMKDTNSDINNCTLPYIKLENTTNNKQENSIPGTKKIGLGTFTPQYDEYLVNKNNDLSLLLPISLPQVETKTVSTVTATVDNPSISQQNITKTQYNIQQSNISDVITKPNVPASVNNVVDKITISFKKIYENVNETTENRSKIKSNRANITSNKETKVTSSQSPIKKADIHFNCRNKKSGKYGDNNDCRKFYICIGRPNPTNGMCPINTVFSEIRKQCTNNLSHCVRNNTFRCTSVGRYSDVFKDNFYYICIKNIENYFVRYKFQCADGFHLNKTSVKCIKDMEVSQSEDSFSKNSNEKSAAERNSPDKKSNNNYSNEFECKEEGKFADPNNCRKYYICSKKKSRFRRKSKQCKKDMVFNRDKKRCVDEESYEC